MDHSFLDGVDAQKGRWRDNAAEAKSISTHYYWLGRGRDALEVAYGMAEARPNATTVREVWKKRHGRAAAPLLVVVGYPKGLSRRAVVCGPAGEDPPVVDLDHAHAERLAAAALAEPDRHVAIRFLASALEGDPAEQPGLRNKGLLATHELLHGVPMRRDWGDATTHSRPLLGLRGQDLVRGLGYEIEPRGQHNVLRASTGRAQAVAVFLQETEQPDQPAARFENRTPVTYALSHAERDNLPLAALLLSATRRASCSPEFLGFVVSALGEYVLRNFPHEAGDYLRERLDAIDVAEAEIEVVQAALRYSDAYLDALRSLPLLREFQPPTHRLYLKRLAEHRQQASMMDRAKQSSVLLNIMPELHLKYGRSHFMESDGVFTPPSELVPFAVSAEKPRAEILDPVGQMFLRVGWQSAGLREGAGGEDDGLEKEERSGGGGR